MSYAKIQNTTVVTYPYSYGNFVSDNNNTNYPPGIDWVSLFPQTAAAKGGYSLVEVQPEPQPTFDSLTQTCTEGTPALVNGVWQQTWTTSDLPLATAQQNKLQSLAQAYQSAIQLPVSYTSKGGVTKTYQADDQSVANLTKMLLAFQAAGVTPAGFYWVSFDNTQVPFTYADMQGLASAFGTQGAGAFQHLQTLKASVSAATTVSAVQAVNW